MYDSIQNLRRPRASGVLAAVAAFLIVLMAPGGARAEIYYYKDENGVFHFTEAPVAGGQPFDLERDRRRSRSCCRPSSPARRQVARRPRPERAHVNGHAPHNRYDDLIHEAAGRYGVEVELVKAVIRAESNFDRLAVSHRGARGLMQLMPRTARSYGVHNPHDPRQNIQGGVRHLRRMLDRFGSVRLAVAAYNAGATAVRRYRGIPPYRETRRYVEKVFRFRAEYQGHASVSRDGLKAG